MIVKEGRTFNMAPVNEVYDYLSGVKRDKIMVNPAKLRLSNKESNTTNNIHLLVNNGGVKRYEIRKTFLHKLLRWYHLPTSIIPKLRTDTLVEVCNDLFANIKSSSVNIKFEDGEALTITSTNYTDIPDIEYSIFAVLNYRLTEFREMIFLYAFILKSWLRRSLFAVIYVDLVTIFSIRKPDSWRFMYHISF